MIGPTAKLDLRPSPKISEDMLSPRRLPRSMSDDMMMFIARGQGNLLAASWPTLYGYTTMADSINALEKAIEVRDALRELVLKNFERQQIRSRILEPHHGPPLQGLRSDRA